MHVTVNGSILGTLIVAIFGGVWALYGTSGLPSRSRAVPIVATIAISSALVVCSLHTRTIASQFILAIYLWSVAFEVVLIVITARLLRRSNRRTLIGPAIAIIVGLHFIGLWFATKDAVFVWLSVALVVVGVVATRLPPTARVIGAAFGSALVLWSSALIMILR